MIIGLYGINRLGKSTQANLLVERIRREWGPVEYLKFPAYTLEPTGPLINNYLRPVSGIKNPHGFTAREFQLLNVQNKKDAQNILHNLHCSGHLVLEDYIGTALAWGMSTGIDRKLLETLHAGLLTEDIAILFEGEPFLSGTEKGHTHEENDLLTEKARQAFLSLAKEYGWTIVNANQSREKVETDIWDVIQRHTPSLV